MSAASSASELSKAELKVGAAAKVALLSTPKVEYPAPPEKPGGSVSHGGLLAFTVSEPGTYRVALSTPAWVEVVKDGKAVQAEAFGHGPECTTIRKIVEFPLTAGAHVLELAANADRTTDVLIESSLHLRSIRHRQFFESMRKLSAADALSLIPVRIICWRGFR
jgi:hypothetical protein